jgi:hypothetical protein
MKTSRRLLMTAAALLSAATWVTAPSTAAHAASSVTVEETPVNYGAVVYAVSISSGVVRTSFSLNISTIATLGPCKIDTHRIGTTMKYVIDGASCTGPGIVVVQTPVFPACNATAVITVDGVQVLNEMYGQPCVGSLPKVYTSVTGNTLQLANTTSVPQMGTYEWKVSSLTHTFTSTVPLVVTPVTLWSGSGASRRASYMYYVSANVAGNSNVVVTMN